MCVGVGSMDACGWRRLGVIKICATKINKISWSKVSVAVGWAGGVEDGLMNSKEIFGEFFVSLTQEFCQNSQQRNGAPTEIIS